MKEQNRLSKENILDMTLYQMMEYVDENKDIPVDTVDNLYYTLLDECFDNSDSPKFNIRKANDKI